MSLFLGKIHFWLFNKVLWFQGLEDEIINLQRRRIRCGSIKSEINLKYGKKLKIKI